MSQSLALEAETRSPNEADFLPATSRIAVFENPLSLAKGREAIGDLFGLLALVPGVSWSELGDITESHNFGAFFELSGPDQFLASSSSRLGGRISIGTKSSTQEQS